MRIIVAGMAVTYPLGGVFWDYAQYLLGFHDLGHDVLYVEDTGRWCYDTEHQTMVKSGTHAACWFGRQIAKLAPDLRDRWFYRDATGETYGVSPAEVSAFAETADLFLNVSAASKLDSACMPNACLAFLDTDPMYTQALLSAASTGALNRPALKRHGRIQSHYVFFTFGENIGEPACLIPAADFSWVRTRQPICLQRVSSYSVPPQRRRNTATTVGSWDRYSKPIVVDGHKYYGKSREFRKYLDFPRQIDVPVEVAMAGKAPRETMLDRGWHLADPAHVSRSADTYMRYLAQSFAELSVAKHAYVASNSGWFSCRSACYLALGVPVIVQDTGFSNVLPTGDGLFAFSTMDDAVAAVEAVEANYARHCTAAREIAEQYFDSHKVLTKLLDDAFAAQPVATSTLSMCSA